MHSLVQNSGRHGELAQLFQPLGPITGLLDQLATGSRGGIFARLERAGRKLDECLAHRDSKIANQAHAIPLQQRQDSNRARMLDGFLHVHRTVGSGLHVRTTRKRRVTSNSSVWSAMRSAGIRKSLIKPATAVKITRVGDCSKPASKTKSEPP